MKATVQSLAAAALADKSRVAVFGELIKARLTFLVLLTTLVGFYVGFRGPMDYLLMLHTLLGTMLVASGAAALNQFLERQLDARMRRTEDRPLPSGRLLPDTALMFGGFSSAAGLIDLALAVNLETSVLGAITLCSYLFIYTPLKRTMRRRDSRCCRYLTRTASARLDRRSVILWVCCRSAFVRFCSNWREMFIWPGRWCWAWRSYGRPSSFPAS